MPLSGRERERYSRHLALPEIGAGGQKRLKASRVLVVGAGGLGSPAALYLAAAGIGTLGLVDDDRVEESNLQRQIIHTEASLGALKVDSAGERLLALNAELRLEKHPCRLDEENAVSLAAAYDFVLDATDSFRSKALIARACHEASTPYSHGGISRFRGQAMTVVPGKTACFRCLFDEELQEEGSAPEGPPGALAGIIGSMQALEALKVLLGIGRPLFDRLLSCDALSMELRTIPVDRDPHCPVCSAPRKEKKG
ncbi:HesA/MoeB/ThiF family protein [Chlorobium sp. N1]|uniref:HesA/MoeB/ThiF family protein n=1 Tax=Chlorobium sp. N1 TaxID=2491138 RepID=UPI00103C9234|nr:HesA/MoeB/ThiF family protein [Chlorobium sp. N1]TCD48700.1 HesA/MoeB/ThiF family protein [Chlorobium sp. N1]